MKIAITTTSPSVESAVDPRFGRGAYFVIVDAKTGEWQAHPNPAVDASGGAGVQAAQFIAGHGAQIVISGDFGPKAYSTLAAASIRMFLAPAGESPAASQLLARYQRGELKEVTAPTGPGRHAPGIARGAWRGK